MFRFKLLLPLEFRPRITFGFRGFYLLAQWTYSNTTGVYIYTQVKRVQKDLQFILLVLLYTGTNQLRLALIWSLFFYMA